MSKLTNETFIFCISALGLICTTVLIALGHDGMITYLFFGMNAAALGYGGFRSIKNGGKKDGK